MMANSVSELDGLGSRPLGDFVRQSGQNSDDGSMGKCGEQELFVDRIQRAGVVGVVLAAGQGSRFVSPWPKVLYPFRGKPLGKHAVDAVKEAGIPVVLVVGFARDQVIASSMVEGVDRVVVQHEARGTGHAVFMINPTIPRYFEGDMVVVYGDTPGIDASLLRQLLRQHQENKQVLGVNYAAVILTGSRAVAGEGARNYGRIVRKNKLSNGSVVDIVEKKQIDRMRPNDVREYPYDWSVSSSSWTREELDEIDEFNSGIVVARARVYLDILEKVQPSQTGSDPSKFEYYATDFVKEMVACGMLVEAWKIPSHEQYKLEGANTLEELMELERRLQ